MRSWWKMAMILGLTASHAMAGGLALFGSYWDSKDADDAFGGGAKFRFDINENVQLDLGGSYFSFDDKGEAVTAELMVIPLEAALSIKANAAENIAFYAGGGAGYYIADGEFRGGGEKVDFDPDDEIGFFVMAGIELGLGANLSLIGEVKYVWLEFDKAKLSAEGESMELDIDMKMDGFRANAGLLLKF